MDEDENDGRSSGRTRQHSESSDPKEMFKRTKPSDGGDGDENVSSSSVASSPPRFVNMDTLMETVRKEAARMHLVHEIAVNPDFKLEPRKDAPPPSSSSSAVASASTQKSTAYEAIRKNMLKAYWDIIQEDINKDPPVLDMVFKLCTDIREMLLELLLPHQNATRKRIEELFDIDLIRQQCELAKSTDPLREYGPAILNVMQRLCCPMRDEEIEALRKVEDTIQLFQGIIRVLEEMKLDFANFLIEQIRPMVNETVHEYEKEKMKEIETAQKLMGVEDPFVNTKAWLQRAFQGLHSTINQQKQPTEGAILLQAYMELVFQKEYVNEEWKLPETLQLDAERINRLQHASITLTIASSVILITQGNVSPAIIINNNMNQLKETLKDATIAVLKDVQCVNETDLREALHDLASKVIQDIQRQTNGSALVDGKDKLLHGQLTDLATTTHPVRNVVFGRIVEFVFSMAKSGGKDVKIPPGLSALQTELTKLAADFIKIISINRATHAEKYHSIITDILDTKIDGKNPQK